MIVIHCIQNAHLNYLRSSGAVPFPLFHHGRHSIGDKSCFDPETMQVQTCDVSTPRCDVLCYPNHSALSFVVRWYSQWKEICRDNASGFQFCGSKEEPRSTLLIVLCRPCETAMICLIGVHRSEAYVNVCLVNAKAITKTLAFHMRVSDYSKEEENEEKKQERSIMRGSRHGFSYVVSERRKEQDGWGSLYGRQSWGLSLVQAIPSSPRKSLRNRTHHNQPLLQ